MRLPAAAGLISSGNEPDRYGRHYDEDYLELKNAYADDGGGTVDGSNNGKWFETEKENSNEKRSGWRTLPSALLPFGHHF
jgi:hypothetical protein